MPQMKQRRQNQKNLRKRPRLPASVRSRLQDELTEVTRHRAAISDLLRAIASSPHDLQPVFDAIVDNADSLCEALLAKACRGALFSNRLPECGLEIRPGHGRIVGVR